MFSLDDYDMSQLGFTSSPVEEYQDSNNVKITDPADVNNIQYALINGSTTASASVSSNYELQLQSIVSDASDNSSSRLSAKRKSSKQSPPQKVGLCPWFWAAML